MSRAFFRRRKDANHTAIVSAFRALGCSVDNVEGKKGIADLVVGALGRTHLVEVKPATTLARHQPTAAQQKFAGEWRGSQVHLVRTIEDCAGLVRLWRNQAEVERRAAEALAGRAG